jgi:hypothetical protein
MTRIPSIAEIESQPCPGYTSPFTGETYHREGQTHHLVTRWGVRCASCGVEEPNLRAQAVAAR